VQEKSGLLNWVSIILSSLALVATGITIYVSFFRPVRISLQNSPYLYISNAIGGLPKAKLVIGIIGSGSTNRYQCISNITATIQRKRPDTDPQGPAKEELLIPNIEEQVSFFSRSADRLPIYIRGGEEKVVNIEFGYENTVNKIIKIKEWAASLKNAIPSEELKKQIDQIVGPAVSSYYQKRTIRSDFADALYSKPKTPPVSIESILNRLPPDEYSKYIFFTAGNYQLRVRFLSAQNAILKETVIDFSIDSSEAGRLISVFDEWTIKKISY